MPRVELSGREEYIVLILIESSNTRDKYWIPFDSIEDIEILKSVVDSKLARVTVYRKIELEYGD